jgi:hypothetical protein
MNNFFSKIVIKHYNGCFWAQKWLVNGVQNFGKQNISQILLHKPWHNSILKINIFNKFFEDFKKYIPKNIFKKESL